jgi:prepilin-type N-terminal cleavage/methylation domain-containing protein
MVARVRVADNRGETLIELLIAITILGVCVVAFGTSIALGVRTSDQQRQQANAGAFLRDYAERIASYVSTGSHYTNCAAANTYTPSAVGLTGTPADFTFGHTAAMSLQTNGSPAACTSDNGVQELTLTATGPRVSESLVIVVRKP